MNTAVSVAVFLAIVLGASIYLAVATRRRLKRYWERSCTGGAWLNEFPSARPDDVCKFLYLFVDSFALSRKRALQFAPTDRPLEIYRAIYPSKNMPDALELETFAKRLGRTYGPALTRIWREDITLGEVFAKTAAAPKLDLGIP
jgi:hypothetical protein